MSKVPRTRVASAVASGKYSAKKIAAYLIDSRRTRELDSILRDVSSIWAQEGNVEALVQTAHPLSASAKAKITKTVKSFYPKAHEIQITEVQNREILGGMVVSVAGQVLDLSAESKINKLRQLTEVK